jgi:hypothetical protein
MSGYALEPAGLYGIEEFNKPERMGDAAKPKKKIDPESVQGVIVRIPKEEFSKIVQKVEPLLKHLGHGGFWTSGSAGSWHPTHRYKDLGSVKTSAGDIDIHLPSQEIRQKLGLPVGSDDSQIRAALKTYLQKYFHHIHATGEQVHVGVPTGYSINVPKLGKELPAFYQVDIPTTEHAATTVRHHEHEYAQEYDWDGQDQQMALSSLVNSLPGHPEKTHLYYGFGGALKHRGSGEVQDRDIDSIAQRIFNNPAANQDWLSTVDRILHHLPGGLNNPRLSQFRDDMQKKYPDRFQIQENTVDWFKSIRSKLGL